MFPNCCLYPFIRSRQIHVWLWFYKQNPRSWNSLISDGYDDGEDYYMTSAKGLLYQRLLERFQERIDADRARIILNSESGDAVFPNKDIEKYYEKAGVRLVEDHNILMQRFAAMLQPILKAQNEAILESVADVLAECLEIESDPAGDIYSD